MTTIFQLHKKCGNLVHVMLLAVEWGKEKTSHWLVLSVSYGRNVAMDVFKGRHYHFHLDYLQLAVTLKGLKPLNIVSRELKMSGKV